MKKIHPFEKLAWHAATECPDETVYHPTDGQAPQDGHEFTHGDFRAIQLEIEKLRRALNGDRDLYREEREFIRAYVISRASVDLLALQAAKKAWEELQKEGL